MAAKAPTGRLPKNVYWDKTREQYYAILDLGKDASGKRRRRKMYARTQKEVTDKLNEAKRELEAGLKPSKDAYTVASLLRDYFEDRADDFKSEKTRRSYEWAIEDHLIPAIGGRKVKELSPADVRGMLNSKRDAGLSRATLIHIHGVLKRAFLWGQQNGTVFPDRKTAPELVRTPQAKEARRVGKALTVEEARAVLRTAAEDRERLERVWESDEYQGPRETDLEALYALGIDTPCRPGELTGLPWSAIDFENHVIEFRQALHHGVDGRLYLGGLKTDESYRRVRVSPNVIEALKRRKRSQRREKEWCLAHGVPWADGWGATEPGLDPDLVFTTVKGTPIDSSNVRRSFTRLLKRAGVAGNWTTYELRHSAVSILSAEGTPVEEISKRAGHRNTRVTESVYRHNLRPVIVSGTGVVARLLAADSVPATPTAGAGSADMPGAAETGSEHCPAGACFPEGCPEIKKGRPSGSLDRP